jgi:hypothetical protein
MDMGPNGVYLIFGQNGKQRGGMYIKPAASPGAAHWMPYAHVPSADKGFALAKSTGAKEVIAPMDVPGGSRIAAVSDPAGAPFAIHSVPAVPKAAAAPATATATKAAKPKAKAKVKAKAKTKTAKKPAAKKKVVKKVARKVAKKSARKPPRKMARKPAKKKSSKKSARRKK